MSLATRFPEINQGDFYAVTLQLTGIVASRQESSLEFYFLYILHIEFKDNP